jgi:hypothetical protein
MVSTDAQMQRVHPPSYDGSPGFLQTACLESGPAQIQSNDAPSKDSGPERWHSVDSFDSRHFLKLATTHQLLTGFRADTTLSTKLLQFRNDVCELWSTSGVHL